MNDSEKIEKILEKLETLESEFYIFKADFDRCAINKLCICGWTLMRYRDELICPNEDCIKHDKHHPAFRTL